VLIAFQRNSLLENFSFFILLSTLRWNFVNLQLLQSFSIHVCCEKRNKEKKFQTPPQQPVSQPAK
jgi:hypothetical protein